MGHLGFGSVMLYLHPVPLQIIPLHQRTSAYTHRQPSRRVPEPTDTLLRGLALRAIMTPFISGRQWRGVSSSATPGTIMADILTGSGSGPEHLLVSIPPEEMRFAVIGHLRVFCVRMARWQNSDVRALVVCASSAHPVQTAMEKCPSWPLCLACPRQLRCSSVPTT